MQSPRRVRRPTPDPVFVDGSGRRHRVVKLIGVALSVMLVASMALIVASLFGVAPAGLPALPGLGEAHKVPATAPPAPPQLPQPAPTPTQPTTTATASPALSVTGPPGLTRTNNGRRPTDLPHPSKSK